MQKYNALYAQSGGVTAVINATACGVIQTARANHTHLGKMYAARNGIVGILNEDLIDTSKESEADISALRHTPGGAFGSCRYKLKKRDGNPEYHRLIEVFKAHNIRYFFYNGGGDSQDTTLKISQLSKQLGYPLITIGIPKTIDNDLPLTDSCPGFASTAKYVAVSTREISYDIASMDVSSTKVFVLEVMGRHAGWIAASAGLARDQNNHSPHLILFPEIAFNKAKMLAKVKENVERHGHCVIVASEGVSDENGEFLAQANRKDAFGHSQLGGVAPLIAGLIQKEFGYKYHWAVADYMQRSARHISARVDVEQAYALGKASVELALQNRDAIMTTIVRDSNQPYEWHIGCAPLGEVANQEKKMPRDFIDDEGYFITQKCYDYLQPLIEGEDYPPYSNGMPQYVKLKNIAEPKKLNTFALPE